MYIVQLKVAGWNDEIACETLDEAVNELHKLLNKYLPSMLRIVKTIELDISSVHTVNARDDE